MRKIYKFFRILLAIIFIITSLITITFAVINYKISYDIPPIINIELYDSNNIKYLSYTNGRKQSYVKLDNISENLIDAFISIEDKRYFEHSGIDFIRIGGAIISDIKAGKAVEGASTITQQYVRLLYLNSNKTIKRKLYELMIAMNIESKYSKEEILEGYLNSIYFDHGIYGVEDASLFYFNKHAKDLSISESAILAAIPKGPTIYSPIKNKENNLDRKNLILKELLNDEKITNTEYVLALKDQPKLLGINPHTQNDAAPYFQDLVIKEILEMGFLNDKLYQGVKVYTTLDLELNKEMLKLLETYHPDNEIEFAAYCIEPYTGEVKTIIGGTNYLESTYNRATQAKRQPGSTIKPFLYLAAIEHGFTQSTTFISEPTAFFVNGDSYTPHNYKQIYPNQEVSLVYALATSDNIFAMKTHLFLGEDKLVEILNRFKITDNAKPLPSLALGTHEVTLKDITEGYAVLSNSGIRQESYLIKRITSFDDELLYDKSPETGTRIADESDIFLLNTAMTSMFDPNVSINILPTGARISSLISHKVAAKSGSTDTDNLIIGFSPEICIGIWTGYDDNRKINGSLNTSFGKTIWARTIDYYLDKTGSSWYQQPDNIISVDLNPITGFYGELNDYTKPLFFRKNNIPWFVEMLYKKEEQKELS